MNTGYWDPIKGTGYKKEYSEYCDVKYSLYKYEKGEMQVNGKK